MAQTNLKFRKVTAMPGTLAASTLYFVKPTVGNLSIYITDKLGNVAYNLISNTAATNLVAVSGPDITYVNQTERYQITNFDIKTTYTVTATVGSVLLIGDEIHYTAPAAAGVGGFTINGIEYSVTILPSGIIKPSIIAPPDDGEGVGSSTLFQASIFGTVGTTDAQVSTDWQLSTKADFSVIVEQVINSTADMASWTVDNLSPNTMYYVRMRQAGATLGDSVWSDPVSFTTKKQFIPIYETAQIMAADRGVGDAFGFAAAFSGDGSTLVVSSYKQDLLGLVDQGSIYIYTKANNGWVLQNKITAALKYNLFGYSLAISYDGNTVAAGTPQLNGLSTPATGAVYIFTRVGITWTLQKTQNATSGVVGDRFGTSVALSDNGNTLAAGADSYSNSRGAAYVFTRSGTTWTQVIRLLQPSPVNNDKYGTSVTLNAAGTVLAVGAPYHNNGIGVNSGTVYVYQLSGTWTLSATLASDAAVGGAFDLYFGISVALDAAGTTLAIGATGRSTGTAISGSVYIFTYNGTIWSKLTRVIPTDTTDAAAFGSSLCFNAAGTSLIIGAPKATLNTISLCGSAYVFTNVTGTWSQIGKLTAGDKATNDYFGTAVALSHDGYDAVVGAYNKTSAGVLTAGGVYVFR